MFTHPDFAQQRVKSLIPAVSVRLCNPYCHPFKHPVMFIGRTRLEIDQTLVDGRWSAAPRIRWWCYIEKGGQISDAEFRGKERVGDDSRWRAIGARGGSMLSAALRSV